VVETETKIAMMIAIGTEIVTRRRDANATDTRKPETMTMTMTI
jgi:hypothetical protein